MATTANSRHSEPTGGTLGPRKTLIIMVTIVGCIAILWPKVFYPMMVGPTQTKTAIKDHRGSGCCDVVLDQEETFANMSMNVPNQQNLFRKRNIGPTVEDHSIRQERPPHLRPDTIHPAMRERGRAIPHVGSVHSERPQSPPRIVEGRPGPIPGMRPPMGAGSHQSTKSANSMGFIMPLYTIGIVSFFIYTILKLIFKKTPATPYPEIKPDTTFRNEVFTAAPDLQQQQYIKRPESGRTTKLVEETQDAAQHSTSSTEHVRTSFSTISTSLEQHPAASSISFSSSSSSSSAAIIDQVPTSVSNVTNPKFLTLNLVNYSPSGSSGNNSNSSSASALIQSRNAAGTADVAAAAVASDSSDKLMELDLLRKKLDETELAMTKIIANMGAIPKGQSSRLFKV